MFSTLQNKTVTRVYRNITDFEKLNKVNIEENINLTEIGIKRLVTSLKSRQFQFGDNKQGKLVIAILTKLCEQIYKDTPQVTRDQSFVLIGRHFKGTKWFVREGLEEKLITPSRINDQSLVDLLRKLDKSGMAPEFCDWIRYCDWEILERERCSKFNTGVERRPSEEYRRLTSTLARRRKGYRNAPNKDLMREIKQLEFQLSKLTSRDMMDGDFKRANMVRVGNQVIYGVIGSKQDASEFGKPIHHNDFVEWLGTQCTTPSSQVTKVMKDGRRGRFTHGSVRFYLTEQTLCAELKQLGYDGFEPTCLQSLSHLEANALIYRANRQIQELYQKYHRCTNVSILQSAWYVIEYSTYMTLSLKYKTSIAKLKSKYSKNGKFRIDGATLHKPKFKVKKAE